MADSGCRLAVAVFAVTFVVFARSVRYDITNYDDDKYVVKNAAIRDGLTPASAKWAVTSCGYAANWHPLAWISLMGDITADRLMRGGARIPDGEWNDRGNRLSRIMHLHNVLLHSANAALLFLLLTMLAKGRIAGIWLCLLALAWSLHPLRVEVACWIAERKELTSVFFMLLSLISYFGIGAKGSKRDGVRYGLALVCAALAMFAKPVAVTLPVVLFTWDWAIRGRMRIVRHIPFALMSVATCYLTYISQAEPLESGRKVALCAQSAGIFIGPLVYLRQTFWPAGLSIAYEIIPGFDWVGLSAGALLVLALFAVGVAWLVRKRRSAVHDILVFGIAWVYIGLVPMLGIVKVGGSVHNDRYTYWIGCGACATLVMLAGALWPKIRPALARATAGEANGMADLRRFALYGTGALVALLAVMTWQRMECWRDTITLFRDAVPKSWGTEIALPLAQELEAAYGEAGRAEGEKWLRLCANNYPTPVGLVNLAIVLMEKPESYRTQFGGEIYVEAAMLVEQALAEDPDNKRAKELKELIEKTRKKAKERVQGE